MVALEEADHNGTAAEEGQDKKTLDLFWKLGHAKNEKQALDQSAKILQSVSKSSLDIPFAINKLIMSLAGDSMRAKNAYFVCLTELLRQTQPSYMIVADNIQSLLRTGGTLSKGEEANYLMAQMLAYSAILRSKIELSSEDVMDMIESLANIGTSRNYLYLPAIKMCQEHFVKNAQFLSKVKESFTLKMDSLSLDSMYLLLSICIEDSSEEFLKQVGAKKLLGKKSLEVYGNCILNASMPPQVVADHPGLQLLLTLLHDKKAVGSFWQIFSAHLTASNNRGLLGWMVLKELSKRSVEQIPDLLTIHTLTVGSQLLVKNNSSQVVKDVFKSIAEAGDKVDRLSIIKRMLEVDLCWDKMPGNTITNLLSTSSPDTVKIVAEKYILKMLEDGKLAERVHCAAMLVKIVGLSSLQADLDWRLGILRHLSSVSILTGVSGVAAFNSNGRDQMKDVLFRALDTRNKCLDDSVTLLNGIVKYIQEQIKAGANPVKTLTEEQSKVSSKAQETIAQLEKKYKKTKSNEAGVFVFLYCQMTLQMFLQPDLGVDVLGELDAVCDRWSKGGKESKSKEEPEWIEVVTEVLISLLAQNNHLLRAVVGSVFSVLGKDLTAPAMESMLAVIKKKDEGEKGDDDEDEEEEDMDDDVDEDKDNEDDSGNDSDEDEEESEDEDNDVDDDMRKKLTSALGDHAAGEESDLEMDDIPEEEMAKLDEKLVDAFKALGGRKDRRGKKKAEQVKIANMHFKLRVLELIEIYLNHSPNPKLVPSLVTALVQSLDAAVRTGGAKEPLIKRLQSTLAKVCSAKFKPDQVSDAVGDSLLETLSGLLELGSSGSVVISSLGQTFPRLTTALLKLCLQCEDKVGDLQKLYESSQEDWLHKPTCILPNTVFSLAMVQDWVGCWSLASLISEAAFNSKVRQFRRAAALSILSSMLANKQFCADNTDSMSKLLVKLLPSVTSEICKVESVDKVKPKYLGELFAILSNSKEHLDSSIQGKVEEKLLSLSKSWPKNQAFVECKKQLLRLLKNWNLKVEFTFANSNSKQKQDSNGVSNGHHVEEASNNGESKKKKKKKHKSQETLKQAKEMKMRMAQSGENDDLPSFVDLANEKVKESPTKRVNEEDSNKSVKAKKKKSK